MNIIFKYLHFHNFLSYGDAELNLEAKHYCLVSGINNCPKDNAQSNGVGKSTIGSAITWALTGETVQGVKTSIKNLNAIDDKSFVELIFSIDGDEYKIIRIKSPKADLKIELNGKDISGKGIKESENILSSRLPDLTGELLASTIILGQGLPQKFTNNSPSGRKELLEKLSKSDFMIQDLKDRIAARLDILNAALRIVDDNILQYSTQCKMLAEEQNQLEATLETLNQPQNFDAELNKIDLQIANVDQQIADATSEIENLQQQNIDISNMLQIAMEEKNREIEEENSDFNAFKAIYLEKKYALQSSITALNKQIADIHNIKDICPTCGQKIPNIVKPSTEAQEKENCELKNQLADIEAKFSAAEKQHDTILIEITKKFDDRNSATLSKSTNLRTELSTYTANLQQLNATLNAQKSLKSQIEMEAKMHSSKLSETLERLDKAKKSLEEANTKKLYNSNERDNISNRISVVNQMNTLIKRDFRGFLLEDIIKFINNHAKMYALDIFKNDAVEFILDGNNIEITFCDKPFESLSGGEQQRLDLIIQFSIRDMLQEYLNFSSNILFLDEIFDQLDMTAVNAVLECVLNKLSEIDSVFIISHRAGELEIPYDSEIIVTKDKNGISSLISI